MDALPVRACHPTQTEPNLALNLEVCDFINEKQKNYPHDAAVTIVELANSRNPTVSLLALALLDHCMKNCGHAFHLHVATKDFLNELVKRFPEHPPAHLTHSQRRILEMLQEWRLTIAAHSRYKEDLRAIEDMARLLEYKGYMLPRVQADKSSLMPKQTLRSADELEEEDRAAQAAKLQELIRKGTPAALREANELMKVMTGFDRDGQRDYQEEVSQVLDGIEKQIIEANDFITGLEPSEERLNRQRLATLLSECKASQVKIQKMITETEDDEHTERLLLLNDMILDVINKHDLLRHGKSAKEVEAPKPSAPPIIDSPSLIDMGSVEENQGRSKVTWGAAASTPALEMESTSAETVLNDLLGLSFNNDAARTPSPAMGAIALPTGVNQGLTQPLVALPGTSPSNSMLTPLQPTRKC
ncbi:VHS domain-containing protein [Syncephalis fuscata]|nr:VHS domain-containing protein [Syncephalis fuscata]